MTYPASTRAQEAETFLETNFRRIPGDLKYTSLFKTSRGRHIVLSRTLENDIYVWLETGPTAGTIDGVSIKNQRNPGQPYSPTQPRASSLRKSDRLCVGNTAFYIKCETFGAFTSLMRWYDET